MIFSVSGNISMGVVFEMMKEENNEPAKQKRRHRSPNYPSVSLKRAIEKIIPWYRADGIVATPTDAAIRRMGFETLTGDTCRLLSAMKSFGLINEVDGRIMLTPRAVAIVARRWDDPKRKQALKEAAAGPPVYKALLREFAAGQPSDTTLQSELIASKGFNPKSVSGVLKNFRSTLRYCGISSVDTVELANDNEHNSDPEIKVGDYVRWESQRDVDLPQQLRVRSFSGDGNWAYLDGSDTAVSVKELKMADTRTIDTKTPGDLLKRAPAIHPHLKMRSYTWALSGDFSAKLDLFGEAQSMDDLDALIEYVEITVKALKRSLKAASVSVPSPESFAQAPSPPEP